MFANTPEPPYWAVIFSSQRPVGDDGGDDGYGDMAARMVQLAGEQPGFLGAESARDADGFGITVSYWASEQAIAAWKADAEHRLAQQQGFARWYAGLALRVAQVARAKVWQRPERGDAAGQG